MSQQTKADKACRLCYAEGVRDGRREALAEIARLHDIEAKYQAVIREVETPLLPTDTCEQCGGTLNICGKCGYEDLAEAVAQIAKDE